MTTQHHDLPINSGFLISEDPTAPTSDATVPFRSLIPSPNHPRVAGIEKHTARTWCDSREASAPAVAWLISRLDRSAIEKPYRGFSSDGNPDPSVYVYAPDEGAPVQAAVDAVNTLLRAIDQEDPTGALKSRMVLGDVREDDEMRLWSNPELYVNEGGLRLDEASEILRAAALGVLKASLSPTGYHKAVGCTLTNEFLGNLVNGPAVLNRWSYNLRLFLPKSASGPSTDPRQPWGFTFFGHHLCLAVAFAGPTMVIGPTFMGAEPDCIDEGLHAGLRLFREEETQGLALMQGLSPENQKRAQISAAMHPDQGLDSDRWNPFDERHLGGSRQDNRVVPYEGCPITSFTPSQREQVHSLISSFHTYLPDKPLAYRMQHVRKYENQTWFAWIGGFGDTDPYYFRIHSPVVFCEFDFHCGIFLTNTAPAKCHIHTVNRLPNCGDYGRALFRLLDQNVRI